MNERNFATAFKALTGNDPFPWQRALYERFAVGDFPDACILPTGLGKTSVIAVWLIALANGKQVPRRLVYVVNRRTVVDQTTDEVEKYHNKKVPGIPDFAISTLRGQFADNREWSADPSRPAVICGTVDMIGSRLLFSGYGVGFKGRPLHAGFLGQDALLVHDEAHLEPAFQSLLEAIRDEQRRERTIDLPWPKLQVMELTATSRSGGKVFPDDAERTANEADAIVQRRIGAKKRIEFFPVEDEKAALVKKLVEQAKVRAAGDAAVIVFVRSVERAGEVAAQLERAFPKSVEQLNGTLRGYERDGLVKRPVFQRFLPTSNRDAAGDLAKGPAFLVCTSAGEVGVNISADHLVCDLSTFDSMAQRFGRVNRFGEPDDRIAFIDIVHPEKFESEDKLTELDRRRKQTLAALGKLHGDGSPRALGNIDPAERRAAFAPPPIILPTSDILFDAWALTTIKGKLPGRPMAEPYLHGISEWQPLETHVAWREEVVRLNVKPWTEWKESEFAKFAAELLEDYPLKPHELLRDDSSRVLVRLKKLKAAPNTPVWVVADDDTVEVTSLGELLEAGKDAIERKTVLLPPAAGGLTNGMLSDNSDPATDVADEIRNEKGQQRRIRLWDDDPVPDAMRWIRTIDTHPEAVDEETSPARRFWRWFELTTDGDTDGSKSSKLPVLWSVHVNDVEKRATDIVNRLPLSDDLKRAVIIAAQFHDHGKKRKLFQTVLGNIHPNVWLAKSGKNGGRVSETYRHEFGSLVDVEKLNGLDGLDIDTKELVLHLIATHHGRGRPHFPASEAFDPEHSDTAAIAAVVPRRFAQLQRKYGRWGLAYLESLLRAADYAASANPSQEEAH